MHLHTKKHQHISWFMRMLARVFNIAPHEASRVLLAWSLKLCMYTGYAVGWTMLTAMLVNRLGIGYLPLLIVANAALTMLGTVIFSEIIHRVNRRLVLFGTATSGLLLLGGAIFSIITGVDTTVFFALALLANAIFFAQLNILLGLFAEDLFSPLEGSRAWPLIDSSKYIGGIVGGLLILFGISVLHIQTPLLTFFWIGSIALVVPILAWFFATSRALPSLSTGTKQMTRSTLGKMREGMQHLRTTPFLTGLMVVLLLHGMFYAMLNFQYTKAVDEKAGHKSEHYTEQIATTDSHSEDLHAAAPAEPLHASGQNTHGHEDILTHDLGALYIGFSALALFVQFFLTSRIIERMGIVRTMLLHPVVSLLTSLGLTFKFGFASAVVAKASFTTSMGVFNSAYYASFYALKEDVREHAKQLMEGLILPLGTLLGTGLLLGAQWWLAAGLLTPAINFTLVALAGVMGVTLLWMRERYTHVSKKNLDILGDHPAKFSSIEVLAQAGHRSAAEILVKSLMYKKESEPMRIKILDTLGRIRDPRTIPEILMCFADDSHAVKLAAVTALGQFTDLGQHFYSQAFTRFRVISALKELFEREDSQEIRSAIVHVFANMQQAEVVPFLIDTIETASDPVRADAIYVCGLFHDVSAAHYIEPFVKHEDPRVKANAIITLWQFPQYRLRLTIQLTSLLEADDAETQKASIHLLGEIGALQEKPRLEKYLEHDDEELQLLAALALAKLDHEDVPERIADFILHEDPHLSATAKKHVRYIPHAQRERIQRIVHHRLSGRLTEILAELESGDVAELPDEVLAELRAIYAEAGQWHEVTKIDAAIKKHSPATI